ncbi:hypothetical protein BH20ACT15_BH20ACT15_04680 [soil metagenome]
MAILAFLETGAFVGLVAPGEFTVLLGGAVAGQGDISLPLILAITWLSAFLGDTVSFTLGARLGREFLVKHGERFRISSERLKQVEDYFAKHGGKTIVIGRFIGLVRALAPFIAGTSKMPYSNFAPYSIIGTGLWAATFIMIGYFASQSLDRVASIVGRGLIWFGFFVGTVVAVVVAVRYLREQRNRDHVVAEMEKRRPLRPLLAVGRRVKPQAIFLYQRVTPGGLGLELTTLMAIASVGLFVLIAYWSVVAGDPGPTGGDTAALNFADDIRSGWLDDIAEAVSFFGSGFVVFPLAALVGAWLAARRRWTELVILVVGLVATIVSVDLIKDATDRPRPEGGMVETAGSAFPSGHAAYSTIYTWLAIVIAFRIDPGITRRTLLIVAGIAATAAIGLTRVYLRVHWLSDISGGWGLGASAFALVGAAALITVHLRKNLGGDERGTDSGNGAPADAGD